MIYNSYATDPNAPIGNGASILPIGTGTSTTTGGSGQVSFPTTTAPGAVQTAIGLGNQVNSQLPGYNTSLGNIGSNIASETAGQLPQDVINQLTQAAAERGVATGTGGSSNNNAALLSSLGLNSLQLTQQGQTNFQNILPSLPGSTLYENPSLYATPGTYESASATGANIANQQQMQTSNQNFQTSQQNQALAAAKQGLTQGLGTGTGGIGVGGSTMPSLGAGQTKPGATSTPIYDPAPTIGTASNPSAFTPSLANQSPGLVYGNAVGDGAGGTGDVGSTLDQVINQFAPSSGSSYFGDQSGHGEYYTGGASNEDLAEQEYGNYLYDYANYGGGDYADYGED